METTYADSWSDMAQLCDMDLWAMKWRSAWPIFHGPVILPYILKTMWCMYIILCEYESVWPEVWPQNKCRSLWPVFRGPVIWPYILKVIWCINILIWDYDSVWPDVWPQTKFYGPAILLHILKTIWWRNVVLGIMDQCHSKINLVKYMWVSDLYFMVHWFCLISLSYT